MEGQEEVGVVLEDQVALGLHQLVVMAAIPQFKAQHKAIAQADEALRVVIPLETTLNSEADQGLVAAAQTIQLVF